MLRDAVDLTPDGHPDKPGHLSNLGNSLFTCFECLGELSDLEGTISRHRVAVDLSPHGHPNNPTCLNNLGGSFITCFQRLGELSDLEDAVSGCRGAVDLTPRGHPEKPGHLSNLGYSLSLDRLDDFDRDKERYEDDVLQCDEAGAARSHQMGAGTTGGPDSHKGNERIEDGRARQIYTRFIDLDARIRLAVQDTIDHRRERKDDEQKDKVDDDVKVGSLAILDYFDGVIPPFK